MLRFIIQPDCCKREERSISTLRKCVSADNTMPGVGRKYCWRSPPKLRGKGNESSAVEEDKKEVKV